MGGGQRPFGTFPKIHPIWKRAAPLTLPPLWCGMQYTKICMFSFFLVKTMNVRFLFVVSPLFVPKTMNYGTSCRWLGQLSDPSATVTFSQSPLFNFSLLSWEPSSNILLTHQSSVKSFPEANTVFISCAISEPLDIFPFRSHGKVKYMMFSGENALFPDVANIALAKRPQQALTVENLSPLIFPSKLSRLTHRNISQRHKRYIGTGHKGLMWYTKLSHIRLYVETIFISSKNVKIN